MKLNYFKTLFVAILVIFATTTNAETYSGICGDNLNWYLDTETGFLKITGTGEMEDDLWLTHLSPWISYISSIKSVEIADGVTSIGFCAFSGCTGLTSITIPNSVTYIGDYAFRNCSGLTSITIPTSVSSIGNYAFEGCSGLTSVTIPNSVIYIMERAFLGCTGLTSVTIGSGVSDIGEYAFNGCTGLTTITIPNSVTSIGDYTFDGCSGLTLVSIGSGVSDIGDYAFRNCSGLTSITIPNSVTSIGDYAFEGCSGVTSVTIGRGVSEIGKYAFSCRKLTGVYITDLKAWCNIDFGNSTYANPLFTAKKLYLNNELVTNLIIPEGVTTIKNYAFSGCSGLTSVTIGSGVSEIGESAFYKCSKLNSIYSLAEYPPFIYSNTFNTVDKTIPVYIPKGTKEDYEFEWSDFTNFIESDFTGIEDSNIATSEIKVIAGNEIDICNYYGKLQVINLAGQVLKDTYVNGSAQIALPKGVYIVVTDNSSQKVVL